MKTSATSQLIAVMFPAWSEGVRAVALLCTVTLSLGLAGSAQAGSASWTATVSPTNWNDNANWNPNTTYPNAIDDVATITKNTSAGKIINLNTTITIGKLIIGNPYPRSFTIATGTSGTLVFDVSSDNASIVKTGGDDDEISSAVTLNDDLVISNTVSSKRMLISGIISGDKRVIVGGSAYTAFSGANTFTGGFTLEAGAAVVPNHAKAFGAGRLIINGGYFTLLGATGGGASCAITPAILQTWNGSFATYDGAGVRYLDLGTGAVTLSNNVTVAVYNTHANGLTVGGAIGDGGLGFGLTKAGGQLMILNGACTYGGDTVVSNGTLRFTAANAIPNGPNKGNVTVNGTLQITNDTINGLSGTGVVNRALAGLATLTLGDNDATADFSGFIQNGPVGSSIALTKVGTGVQTLSGSNTYSGVTIITNGTLRVAGYTGTNTVTVRAAGILDGTGFVLGTVTVTNNAIITAGLGSPSVGKLTTGALRLTATATAAFDCIAPGNNDQIEISDNTLTVVSGAKVRILGNPPGGDYPLIKCSLPTPLPDIVAPDLTGGKKAALAHDGTWLTATISGGGGTIVSIR